MESTIKEYDLTKGIIWKTLIKFAMPIFFGTLFQALYSMADAIILGRFAGKGALAAIDSVHTLINMPVNFFVGLSSGATIVISQYYGAKKFKKVSEASHNAVTFAFLGGLLLSIIAIVLAPFFTQVIGVPNEIMHDAKRYLIIYYAGMSISMLYNIGAGILRAIGNSKTPFYFLITANIVNIALDLIFVVMFKMGAVGAAIATVISQAVSAILVILRLTKTKSPCKIYIKKLKLYKEHMLEIVKLGLPIGLQATLFPISNTIVQASINNFGVNSIAAWAICGKIDFLIWYVSEAFATAVSTFVAQNYGAKKLKRVKKGIRVGLIIPAIILIAISSILYMGSRIFAGILVKDGEVIELTSQIIQFLAPLYVFYVFCEVFPGAIRGTGESFKPMLITLLGICASRIIWIFFAVPLRPSLFMVLACYPMSWILTTIIFAIFYITNTSKKLQLLV